MSIIVVALALLSGLATLITVWQWLAARRFPLHERVADLRFAPSVTVLKPLKGADAHTEDCLRSWFLQNYGGRIQLLFAVTTEADAAAEIVRRLIAQFPDQDAKLIVTGATTAANAKVGKLARLAESAAHDVWMISDADVKVSSDYVSNAVAPLADVSVGLAFSFYRLANPSTLAMRWEAVAINADFWSQVLQGRALRGIDFALGAVMTTRRQEVQAIGGFAALQDCLADDYQIGHRIAYTGKRIEICPVVVECWDAPQGWRAVWAHQLRWARTVRVCMPVSYFLSVIGNATAFALSALLVQWCLDVIRPCSVPTADGPVSIGMVEIALGSSITLLVRAFTARSLHRRLSPETSRAGDAILVWLKDLLQFALWLGAFVGDTVEWRGVRYRVRSDGTLQKIPVGKT